MILHALTMMSHFNTMSHALAYADLGYLVFPCVPNGKAPLTKRGFKDATTEPGQIESWWKQTPSANVAISTQGLLVVDVDKADNRWPFNTDMFLDLMIAPMAITPRGGRHYIFRKPAGKEWRCTAGQVGEWVDTRTDGGYILVAPSRVNDDYFWIEGNELDIPIEALPVPPLWLDELLSNDNKDGAIRQIGDTDGNVIKEGCRNSTLAAIAGNMRRIGMGKAEIMAAVTVTNSLRCDPPVDDNELIRVINSICRYKPDDVWTAIVECHWDSYGEGDESE